MAYVESEALLRQTAIPRLTVRRWSALYKEGVAALVLVVCFMDLGNYFQVFTGGAVLPRSIYLLLAVLIVPLILSATNDFIDHLCGPQSIWILGFLTLNVAHWAGMTLDGDRLAAELTSTRVQYLALTLVLMFALRKVSIQFIFYICASLAVVVSTLQVVDFFNPGLLVPADTAGYVLGRAASTLINANKAVEVLLLLAVLGMAVLSPLNRCLLMLIVLPGVFLSFSRSGLLAWMLVVALGFYWRILPRSAMLYSMPVLGGVIAGLLFLLPDFIFEVLNPSSLGDIYARLSFWSSGDVGDDSAQERFAVARGATDAFLANPLVGKGSGYTYFWPVAHVAPHNQHLLVLAEYGLVGYGILVSVFVIVLIFRRTLQTRVPNKVATMLFVVVCWFSIFTHNMLDNLYWLLTLSLITSTRRRTDSL